MSIAERWKAYADAFEESYEDDDWSRIEPYFTEDASYESGPEPAHGRDAVLAKLKGGVDGFDRRMDSRTPVFQEPQEDGNTVTIRWRVSYTKEGVPDLEIFGTEVAEFEGDRIKKLSDEFDPEAMANFEKWMTAHGALLQG